MQLHVELSFKAGESRSALGVFADRQPILKIASGREEDEVVDVIKETARLGAYSFGRMTQTEINTIAEFARQGWITNFEGGVTRMWPLVVKLFERWRAMRM